jgi:hypothetical protein
VLFLVTVPIQRTAQTARLAVRAKPSVGPNDQAPVWGMSVAVSIFTPGPIVDEIATRLM